MTPPTPEARAQWRARIERQIREWRKSDLAKCVIVDIADAEALLAEVDSLTAALAEAERSRDLWKEDARMGHVNLQDAIARHLTKLREAESARDAAVQGVGQAKALVARYDAAIDTAGVAHREATRILCEAVQAMALSDADRERWTDAMAAAHTVLMQAIDAERAALAAPASGEASE